VNVHLKSDIVIGGKRGPIDFKRIVQLLRDGGYRGWISLKYEQQEDAYTAVPRYLEEMRAALNASLAGRGNFAGLALHDFEAIQTRARTE